MHIYISYCICAHEKDKTFFKTNFHYLHDFFIAIIQIANNVPS